VPMSLLAMLICLQASAASASLRYRNPLRDPGTGRPLSCPDPHVIDLRKGVFRYFMVCTTDHDADAITVRRSRDLVHWYPAGFVFPEGRHPWWSTGRFWSPEIQRIRGKWVVYFAASVDSPRAPIPLARGTMVLGVATAPALRGPWRTRILHYRSPRERFGGTIDPSVVRSPLDGRLYLFWALQPTQVWTGRLSPDGLTLEPNIRRVVTPTKRWECAPNCVIEAPEPFYRGRTLNLLYSGASTWDGSYGVGLSLTTDPLRGQYRKADQPVLRSGRRFIGPGHCSQPVTGPDGRTYVLYHALTSPDPRHISNRRLLMLAPVSWKAGQMVINSDGRAG
jgi:GH43 family beta-xylosidase